jgi:hypothetical protein
VEQAFRPAVKLIKKPALAAEVPDSVCLERKDAPSCIDTPPPSGPVPLMLCSESAPFPLRLEQRVRLINLQVELAHRFLGKKGHTRSSEDRIDNVERAGRPPI